MSDAADRREARRFTMTLPLRISPRKNQNPELVSETRDVSYQGIFFLSETNFQLGSEIEFVITLPQQITQSGEVNIRCQGKIIRVQSNPKGLTGIAAKIEHYEFVPAASAA
ncbi:MAG TPA: PilZ domain-containing protein [Candidatus Saccharimonadales bacterium]|nr:PilZ domain-containing protein [Candidatus Saccharimonadales bacterium]